MTYMQSLGLEKKRKEEMLKYKVEWYIDYPGMDGIREMEVKAKDEDEANEIACDILMSHWTIGEINEIKEG